jgi:hypothetical protein
MYLDEVLPRYDVAEFHATWVDASPVRIYEAVKQVTPAEIPSFVVLMTLRALPGRLTKKTPAIARHHSLLAQALMSGFVLLGEKADEEIVLGIAGQFWKPTGAVVHLADEAEFAAFNPPGHVKAAMNFHIAEEDDSCRVTTTTRVLATDRAALRKFRPYWLIVRPGSGAIRRGWLRAIKRRAERS